MHFTLGFAPVLSVLLVSVVNHGTLPKLLVASSFYCGACRSQGAFYDDRGVGCSSLHERHISSDLS